MHRLGLMSLLLLASAATAEDNPAATVRYRHVVMESVGDHMKASGFIVKGKISRTDDLVMHATAIHETSKMYDQLFPKGTGPDTFPKSDSLPAIWSDWDGFVKANDAFKDASGKFLEAAKTGDMAKIQPAMGALGKSCGGCHDTYRKGD